MCMAPNDFLLEESDHLEDGELYNVSVCHVCEKDFYSCYGGTNILANPGYQRVNPP